MSIALEERIVKRRIDDYIWRDQSSSLTKLRLELKSHFLAFDQVAIIGGLVRDFAHAGQTAFNSDVDIVIDAPQHEVEALAQELKAKSNRFGGYSYQHPNWKIDFWALENTWALKHGHVSINRLEDITKATFFDWDATIYDIVERKIYSSPNYLEKLRNGIIDINLETTPSIDGNLLRAIRRILIWDLVPGKKLSDFITRNLDKEMHDRISKIEIEIYNTRILSQFNNTSEIIEHVHVKEGRYKLFTTHSRQLNLPGL